MSISRGYRHGNDLAFCKLPGKDSELLKGKYLCLFVPFQGFPLGNASTLSFIHQCMLFQSYGSFAQLTPKGLLIKPYQSSSNSLHHSLERPAKDSVYYIHNISFSIALSCSYHTSHTRISNGIPHHTSEYSPALWVQQCLPATVA